MRLLRILSLAAVVLAAAFCAGCKPPHGVVLNEGRFTNLQRLIAGDNGYYLIATLAPALPGASTSFTVKKLDQSLSTVWSRLFTTDGGINAPCATPMPGGGLLVGTGATLIQLDTLGGEVTRISVTEPALEVAVASSGLIYVMSGASVTQLNAIGSVQWLWRIEDIWPSLRITTGVDIVPTDDGGVFVVANQQGIFNAEIHLARLDINGEIAWRQMYDGSLGGGAGTLALDWEATVVAPVNDGGLLIAGNYPVSIADVASNGFFLRLSADGGVQWVRRFGAPAAVVSDAVQTADGGFAASMRPTIGYVFPLGPVWRDYRKRLRTYEALKVDAAGNVLWREEYRLGWRHDGETSAIAPNLEGGVVLGGYLERRRVLFSLREETLREALVIDVLSNGDPR